MGWRTQRYGPERMSSWPCLTVTEPLQLCPRCERAQTASASPAVSRHAHPIDAQRARPQPLLEPLSPQRPAQQPRAEHQRQQVRRPRGASLVALRRLDVDRRDRPEGNPREPQQSDEGAVAEVMRLHCAGARRACYSRSLRRYHSIASTSAGRRSADPPGKLACGMRANTSKRPAVPLTASATSLPAMPVRAMPCPEKPCRKYTLGASRPKCGARFSVMSTSPPQAYSMRTSSSCGNTASMRARVALGASKERRPE